MYANSLVAVSVSVTLSLTLTLSLVLYAFTRTHARARTRAYRYVMIGLVLMSFATSLLFDGYISHQRATAAHEREESQKLLFATFALLVTDPANQEQKVGYL